MRHQRFTGPFPPAPLRTKATTKCTDESQMSRQSSKKSSWPQRQRLRNTHTSDDCSDDCSHSVGGERVPLCRDMRICGRLLCASACLMSVCGTDTDMEEAQMHRRMDKSSRAQQGCSVSIPVAFMHWLHTHRRNHGKQRLAFLWWKVQFNVDNTFLFQLLFRVNRAVISALQPDILKYT